MVRRELPGAGEDRLEEYPSGPPTLSSPLVLGRGCEFRKGLQSSSGYQVPRRESALSMEVQGRQPGLPQHHLGSSVHLGLEVACRAQSFPAWQHFYHQGAWEFNLLEKPNPTVHQGTYPREELGCG